MKIAAVVILYNSTIETITNIKSYYEAVEKIFVFDNTETESLIRHELQTLPKIEFFHNFENEGIARRLNQACQRAIAEKFEWLLTMDQDSSFSQKVIFSYFNCFKQHNKINVAVIGTKYGSTIESASTKCDAKEAEDLITSGMLINLSFFEEIGGFDEALFIDYVDNDYCIRAKMAGYNIIQFSNISIVHQLGQLTNSSSIKTLFLIKKKKNIHSPLRCYYMYRNMLYLEQKFKITNKKFAQDTRRHNLARIKICMLYGRQASEIRKYIKLAKIDFENNKMGKISQEL